MRSREHTHTHTPPNRLGRGVTARLVLIIGTMLSTLLPAAPAIAIPDAAPPCGLLDTGCWYNLAENRAEVAGECRVIRVPGDPVPGPRTCSRDALTSEVVVAGYVFSYGGPGVTLTCNDVLVASWTGDPTLGSTIQEAVDVTAGDLCTLRIDSSAIGHVRLIAGSTYPKRAAEGAADMGPAQISGIYLPDGSAFSCSIHPPAPPDRDTNAGHMTFASTLDCGGATASLNIYFKAYLHFQPMGAAASSDFCAMTSSCGDDYFSCGPLYGTDVCGHDPEEDVPDLAFSETTDGDYQAPHSPGTYKTVGKATIQLSTSEFVVYPWSGNGCDETAPGVFYCWASSVPLEVS